MSCGLIDFGSDVRAVITGISNSERWIIWLSSSNIIFQPPFALLKLNCVASTSSGLFHEYIIYAKPLIYSPSSIYSNTLTTMPQFLTPLHPFKAFKIPWAVSKIPSTLKRFITTRAPKKVVKQFSSSKAYTIAQSAMAPCTNINNTNCNNNNSNSNICSQLRTWTAPSTQKQKKTISHVSKQKKQIFPCNSWRRERTQSQSRHKAHWAAPKSRLDTVQLPLQQSEANADDE